MQVAISGRRIAASSLTLVLENVLRLGLTAAVSFWIARELGPAEFGLLNFASALMAIFLAVASLGLEVPAVLRLGTAHNPGAVLGTLIALRGVAAALACLGAVLAALVLKHDNPKALAVAVIVALSIVGYAPSVFDLWFKAHVQAAAPAAMRLLSTLIASGVKVACLALDGGVIALAWSVVFEAALSTALLWLAWRRAARRIVTDPLQPERKLARSLLRESWPYLGSGLAVLIYMKLDVILLGAISSDVQTGLYSVAQKLSEVLYIVPIALVDSAYPALARRRLQMHSAPMPNAQAGSPLAQDGQLLFDLSVAAALIATLCGVLFAGPLIHLVFGSRYAESTPLFYLHAWTCLPVALHAARHRWLATAGLQRHAIVVTVTGAVINAALNAAMIPRWGALGAVWSALLALFISAYMTSFLIRDLRPIGVMQTRALWPWARLHALARRGLGAP